MKILIAVIAFNEEQNIGDTLRDLKEIKKDYDVVVIDNASTDDTVRLCTELGFSAIRHSINTGGAFGTVMTYFLYAFEYHYDILCQFDGDGQHLASELPRIIEPILKKEADYVIGSRFLKKDGVQPGFFRSTGIRLFAFLDSKIIGQRVTDVTSGFRAYNRKVIEFYAKHYKHEISDTNQLLLLCYFAGARIKEVPVKMRERKYGISEYTFLNAISFPFKGVINITGCLLQRKKVQDLIRRKNGHSD